MILDTLGVIVSIAGVIITLIVTFSYGQTRKEKRLTRPHSLRRGRGKRRARPSRQTYLLDTLASEGLQFSDVQKLAAGPESISAKTISDIATGRRQGTTRSRMRILAALNKYPLRRQDYTYENLFSEPIRTVITYPSEGVTLKDSFADRDAGEPQQTKLTRGYKYLLRYLSPDLREELTDYLDDGLEARTDSKSRSQFVIEELLSLTLSVGKLKLIHFSKRCKQKIFRD